MNKEHEGVTAANFMDDYEERREKVKRFNMTSDIFFCKVLEDCEACQEVVRILLGSPGISVKTVKSQYSIRNIENHSVTLDILAEDMEGRMISIEMQMGDQEDHQKRVRYYQASIDMSYLEKGVPYDRIPELYLIFITEKDFLGQDTGLYFIDRTIRNTGKAVYNGIHEIYANLSRRCDDEKVNGLLSYMKKSDSDYQTELFPNVVKRVKFYKEKKEGVRIMCEILDKEREEGRKEGRKEGETIFALLTEKLLAASRTEDLLKAANNKEFREMLYKQYGIKK